MEARVRCSGASRSDRGRLVSGLSSSLVLIALIALLGPGCAPRVRAADLDAKQASGAPAKPAAKAPLPTDTITAYREALERDDAAAAYRLLSPSVQQQLSLEKWSARWKETPLERAAQRKLLLETRTSSGGSIAMQAAIALPQGTELLMAPATSSPAKPSPSANRAAAARSTSSLSRPLHRSTDWQVADPDLAAVHAETPEQVLHLLIEAVEQRNYFALLRLLSTTERKVLETELRERIDRLRNSLARKKPPTNPTNPAIPGPAIPGLEVHGDRAHYQYDPRFFVDLVRERDGWRVLDLN